MTISVTHDLIDARPVLRKSAVGTGSVSRLRREAERLRAAAGPGVPDVLAFEAGESSAELTIEFVAGPTLATSTLDSDQAEQLRLLVERLHGLGLVHGAITPDHVIVGPDGPVLCGFGHAETGEPAEDLTAVAAMTETPRLRQDPSRPRLRASGREHRVPTEGPRRSVLVGTAVLLVLAGLLAVRLLTGTDSSNAASPEALPPETVPDQTVPDETGPDETVPPETVPPETVAPSTTSAPSPCPGVELEDPLGWIDPDERGCLLPVVIDEQERLTIGSDTLTVSAEAEWYLAPWWCDQVLPAALADGWLHLFDRWPLDGEPASAVSLIPIEGEVLALQRNAEGCTRIVVESADGELAEIDPLEEAM